MPPRKPESRADFEIALICALKVEAEALESHAIFEKFWGREFDIPSTNDNNSYTTGVVGEHNAVLLRLPRMGKTSSSGAITDLHRTFPGIRLTLVIGVCGGVPDTKNSRIYLGDLIFSTALVQYDFGRQTPKGFARKVEIEDSLPRLDVRVAGVLSKLETRRSLAHFRDRVSEILEDLAHDIPETSYPGADADHLYRADYEHRHHDGCGICSDVQDEACRFARESLCEELHCEERALLRQRNQVVANSSRNDWLGVHFGRIGSGDTVMRSGLHRDKIARENGIIAFEMEGAGVWNYGPSIVVKGVCDYSDAHKNKSWQFHASAVAAAGAKAFLEHWAPTRTAAISSAIATEEGSQGPPSLEPPISNIRPRTPVDAGSQREHQKSPNITDPEIAEEWMDKFRQFKDFMLPKYYKTTIRIAILDTGFSSNIGRNHIRRRVVSYKDFISKDSSQMIDDDPALGGTKLVTHLCTLWSHADCVVGRVAKSNRFEYEDEVVADAIKWADEEMKADIIVFTLGFEDPIPAIRSAIRVASNHDRIIIAAADSALNDRKLVSTSMFEVSPVFACDGHAQLWKNNPQMQPDKVNLAFLGAGVPVLTRDGHDIKSGTTVAAITAAATLAVIMQLIDTWKYDHDYAKKWQVKDLPLAFRGTHNYGDTCTPVLPWKLVEGLEHLKGPRRTSEVVARISKNIAMAKSFEQKGHSLPRRERG